MGDANRQEDVMELEGQVAVVTGASSGIGRAVARTLAGEGASVVLVARRAERLEELADELNDAGMTALAVTADVSDEGDVDRVQATTVERFGAADILVNNVGVGSYGPLPTMTVEDYDWMMRSNVRSSFLCTHRFLPAMLERGSGQICFIGSVAGLKGLPGESVYCASKFAQMGFAQALDYETREQGVKVSVVAPGGVNTEFAIGTGRTAGDPMLDAMLDADDVASAVRFALTQPEGARTFLIGLRPMSEPL
jgi:NADP-dependent 3-hydroxy acid dehydrogenase YdfG